MVHSPNPVALTEDGREAKKNAKAVENELERQDWYHGMRPRKEVEGLLKDEGDFLVRATDNDQKLVLVISLKLKEQTVHLTLGWKINGWSLTVLTRDKHSRRPVPTFPSIPELIDYYKHKPTPYKVKLKKAILRPHYHIKHCKVKYDPEKDFLGSGNFCSVYKGLFEKIEGQEPVHVALKIWNAVEKTGETGGGTKDESTSSTEQKKKMDEKEKEISDGGKAARNAMLTEAKIMSFYKHTHVIEFYGVACDHPPVMIVMEYCPGGNLEKHLRTQGPAITKEERVLYGYEAARGMRYLHRRNCVHRDLAARNCLISATGHIKISDFGLSALVGDDGRFNMKQLENDEKTGKENQVPVRWMAPESLKKGDQFSYATDVWSYGVLLYEIFNNGEKPWPDDPPKKIATMIRKGKMPAMPTSTPYEVTELVSQIWSLEPEKRPQMKDVYKRMTNICSSMRNTFPKELSLNKIDGVKRSIETGSDTLFGDLKNEEEGYEEDDNGKGVALLTEVKTGARKNQQMLTMGDDKTKRLVDKKTTAISEAREMEKSRNIGKKKDESQSSEASVTASKK